MLIALLEELTPQLCRRVPGEKTGPLLARLIDALRKQRIDAPGCDQLHKAAHLERFVETLRVHQVIDPEPVLQYAGSVIVIDEAEEVDGVAELTTLAQCTSRRILSSASRAVS